MGAGVSWVSKTQTSLSGSNGALAKIGKTNFYYDIVR